MTINNTNVNETITVYDASMSDAEAKLVYADYKLECAAEETKAKTFHQWKNTGNIVPPVVAGTTAVATASTQIPKSVKAKQVFARHAATGTLVRKTIISDFISEALLTDAGAKTYYSNISNEYKKDHEKFMINFYVAPIKVELEDGLSGVEVADVDAVQLHEEAA